MEVRFRVRCLRVAEWERLFVVGSTEALGNWLPSGAVELQPFNSDRHVWVGSVQVPEGTKELLFRYLVGYHLDAATEFSQKQVIVARWESVLHPRRCLLEIETKNGIARNGYTDDFGKYNGKEQVSDGWICHGDEHVVLLRIHGEALKFYKRKFKMKEMRLKVVPFDVRFKESFRPYDARRRSTARTAPTRGILWRLSSVYHQTKGSVDAEDAPEEERDPVLPDVPSFSNTELSVLTRDDPIFGSQYENGSIFRNNVDYLVFRTRTVSIENLAFRIELYHEQERVGMAYALPAALPDTYGKSTFPIICTRHTPVGQLDVDYMLVKPLSIDAARRDSMLLSYSRHWRKRKTLEVGHRGMGNSYTKCASERENTIQSLKKAAKRGADFVEFDVQLTKDLRPVVYHDFHVLVEVAGRNGQLLAEEDVHKHHEMAIKDLKLSQLNMLHFEHTAHSKLSGEKVIPVVPTQAERNRSAELPKGDDDDNNPFPGLETVLKAVDPHVGFNIEVKYPMWMKDGTHECDGYFERNQFVDTILTCVFTHAAKRRIVFSSFDPDVCTLIAQKQHTYPVLFLVVGATTRYVPFRDVRSDCSKMAIHYAAATGLLGINFHSEELLTDRNPLTLSEQYKLVSFVWGDDLNVKYNQDYFKNELRVDGLIYDRIGEFEQRQNVFLVEKEAREALFRPSPAPSRKGSFEMIDTELTHCFDSMAIRGKRRSNSQVQ